MADDSLEDFLGDLRGKLINTANGESHKTIKENEQITQSAYFTIPAPNAIEWSTSDTYLGIESLYYHVRQYQIIRDFFQLRCPLPCCNQQSDDYIDCWGKGKEYLQSENLLTWSTKYNDDICPSCKSTRTELVADGMLNTLQQLHGLAGMRSGKSSVAAVIGTYVEHRVVTLGHRYDGKLHKILKQLPNQPLEMTFVASTDVQSADTIWAKYVGLRSNSKWFNEYIKYIKKMESEQATVDGAKPWAYVEQNKYIINGYLNLKVNSLNSNCFVGDTKVLMSDYKYKSIRDVKVGDLVLDRHGHTQTVENHWEEAPTNGLVEITTYFGRKLVCTPNHKFPVWAWPRVCSCGCGEEVDPGRGFANKHQNNIPNDLRKLTHVDGTGGHIRRIPAGYQPLMDLTADQIRPADFLMIPRKFDSVKVAHTLEQSRLLGYYISEGCHNKYKTKAGEYNLDGSEFSFNINEDTTHAEDVRQLCNTLGIHHNTSYIPSRNVLVITTTNANARSLAEWLDANGGHLAKPKVLSETVMRWPVKHKIELLKGMFRGDGTHYIGIGRLAPSVSYTTASQQLGLQLQIILAHVGIYAGLVHHIRKPGGYNKVDAHKHMVNIGGEQAERFAELIWGQTNRFDSFNRSKNIRPKCWVDDNYIYVPVKSVKILDRTEPVYNLTVSNDHSYLVEGIGTYNSGGLAGRTRIAAFIDELARFENTDSARSADEAYRVLENSLRTLRSCAISIPEIPSWLGTMVSISSPISEDDKAMRLLKQAPRIKGMYYFHYATWEFNPDQPRSLFDDDFEKDPIGAMRDFGARPPSAASPLIADQAKFRELAIDHNLVPTAVFKKSVHVDKTGREYVSAVVVDAQLSRNGERYISFDAGQSFDQFAAACAHGEWVVTPEGRQLVTVYDWVYRLTPDLRPRRDVWFDFVINMIDHLQKYYLIARVEFDRWQSTYLIQMIRNRGIMCEMKSTTADQFLKFINDVTYSKVRMLPPLPDDHKVDPPYMSAQGLAFYEIEHLERSSDLKRIHNPLKGTRIGYNSDDTATVVCHVNSMVQASVIDVSTNHSKNTRLRREQTGGYSWDAVGKIYRPAINKRGW